MAGVFGAVAGHHTGHVACKRPEPRLELGVGRLSGKQQREQRALVAVGADEQWHVRLALASEGVDHGRMNHGAVDGGVKADPRAVDRVILVSAHPIEGHQGGLRVDEALRVDCL